MASVLGVAGMPWKHAHSQTLTGRQGATTSTSVTNHLLGSQAADVNVAIEQTHGGDGDVLAERRVALDVPDGADGHRGAIGGP